MIHPNTIVKRIDEIIGYGVFSTAFIPRGTITWIRDAFDREIDPKSLESLPNSLVDAVLTYAYRNNKGNYVMPWDHTKYVNHSFYANTMLTPYGFEIAIKDIENGEQITNDYGTLNIIESFCPIDEGHERKMVHPNDLATFFNFWDEEINAALPLVLDLQQPLKAYTTDKQWQDIENIVTGKSAKLSMLTILYNK